MDLSLFNAKEGFDRGRPRHIEAMWYLCKIAFFVSALPWPIKWKVFILKRFGAKIGSGFYIQPEVSIHFPWKLEVGDNCWIGKQTEIHNMEFLKIGDNVAIAHRVFITTGSHDFTKRSHPYRNRATTICSKVWIASCAFIGPGIVIGEGCVIYAGSIVTRSTPNWKRIGGNPAQIQGERIIKE
jgi:putative colanic acid biosynthesis acetyltransferase WcaF